MDGIKEAVKNMDEKGKEWAENMQAKGKATGEMLREERIKLDIKAKATFMPGMFIRNEHDKPVRVVFGVGNGLLALLVASPCFVCLFRLSVYLLVVIVRAQLGIHE